MGATQDEEEATKAREETGPRQVAAASAVAAPTEAGKPEVRTSQQPLLLRTLSVANVLGRRAQ